MSKERMLAPRSLPWGQGLVRCLLPGGTVDSSCSLGAPGKDTIHEVDTDASWRGVCSCSTTNSLTWSLPTSNSPMLRRSILHLLIASARIARAPMARAPKAPAPTARAPSAPAPLATHLIATRPKAACLPGAEWFFLVIVRFLTILLPCPSSPWSCVPPNRGPKARPHRSRRRPERVLPRHQQDSGMGVLCPEELLRELPSWPRPVRIPSSDQPPYSTLTNNNSEMTGSSVVGSML